MIDKVKIGPITYAIARDDTLGDSGFAGQIRYFRSAIAISGDLKPQFALLTLWHEIVHGIMTNAGIPHDEQKESLVDAIAYGVLQVIVDNPDLVNITRAEENPYSSEMKFTPNATAIPASEVDRHGNGFSGVKVAGINA